MEVLHSREQSQHAFTGDTSFICRKFSHYSAAVELGQVLADPQSQSRSAAALQVVAIELRELVEHLGLILDRDPYTMRIEDFTMCSCMHACIHEYIHTRSSYMK